MFSKISESKFPKVPGEVILSNGERSGLFGDFICPPSWRDFPKIPIKESDVILITYGRSGTIFTQLLIMALMERTTKHLVGLNEYGLAKYVSFLEWNLPGQNAGLEAATEKMTDSYRILKTHLPRWLAPTATAGKKVFVVRDVKDTLVSYFHFYQDTPFFGEAANVNFDTFYEMFISGNVIYSDWFQFYRDWLDYKGENVIWLRYEDLTQKFEETLKRLANFLEVELTDKLFEDIRQLVDFQEMRKKFCFVRKGIVGDHTNYLTAEQIKYLDAKTKEIVPELYFQ